MPTSKAQLQHRIEDAKRLGWHGDKIAAILDILELMANALPEQGNGKMVDPIADIVKLPRELVPDDAAAAKDCTRIQSIETSISIGPDDDPDEPDTCSFGEAQKAAREGKLVECQFKSPNGIWFKARRVDREWTFSHTITCERFDPSTATAWRILDATTEPKRESGDNGAGTSETWEDSEV